MNDRPITLCNITQTDEIHSVKCLAIDETTALIDRSLLELQIEIDNNIPDNNKMKTAYLLSQCTVEGRSFVNSRQFRLRFLRYELFDIQKSAIRMLRWLEFSYSLFGAVALVRPICLSTDFTLHEQKVFRKGYVQLLPFRASGTGRQIICVIPYDEKAILKILAYTFWVVGNDIDTQRKGVVIIVMFDSSFHQVHQGAGMVRRHSNDCTMSVRPSAIHICTPDTPFFRLRRHFLTMAIGSHNRSRLKLHVGTTVELRYILQVYGIPIESIPITYTGKIKLAYVRQWLRIRNMIEDQEKLIATNYNTNNTIVEAPYLHDVLFKPGTSFTNHPGNITLRNIIQSKVKQLYEDHNDNNKPQLKVVTKDLKRALVLEIIDEIVHIHRGRFVYWHKSNNMSDCWWVLLHTKGNIRDEKLIFDKIGFLFRKSYTKKQQQHQKLVKLKHKVVSQEDLIQVKTTATIDQNKISNNKKKIKIPDSLIMIDSDITAITRKTTTSASTSSSASAASTTIKQNGGTYLFHSLDGNKHNNNNNTRGLLSLPHHHHDYPSSSDSDDNINIIMPSPITPSSSSLSLLSSRIPSSECFGMKFVPTCYD